MRNFYEQRKAEFPVLQVELDPLRTASAFDKFLLENTPEFVWSPVFLDALGVHKITLVTTGDLNLRGLAKWNTREVHLTVPRSTRWMQNTESSTINGLDDLSPSGVLCHELGHHFQWQLERFIGSEELLKAFSLSPLRTAVSPYATVSVVEDFAETFRVYLSRPDLLRKHCILRYGSMLSAEQLFEENTGVSIGSLRHVSVPFAQRVAKFAELKKGR